FSMSHCQKGQSHCTKGQWHSEKPKLRRSAPATRRASSSVGAIPSTSTAFARPAPELREGSSARRDGRHALGRPLDGSPANGRRSSVFLTSKEGEMSAIGMMSKGIAAVGLCGLAAGLIGACGGDSGGGSGDGSGDRVFLGTT